VIAPSARLARLSAALLLIASPLARAAEAEAGPRTRRAAAVLSDSQQRAGFAWQTASVYHPIEIPPSGVPKELTALTVRPPGAPAPTLAAAQTRGAIGVGPLKAAMLRLEPLQIARVRALGRERPRFHRVTGEDGQAWASASEGPPELTPGTWLLEQPPGGPGYWLVTAPRETRVVIEVVAPRTGDLIWEHATAAVLAWIDEGGPAPPLPEVAGAAEARRELLADAEIAAEIERLEPEDGALRRAVAAWRAVAAIQRIDALRRPIRPAFALELRPRTLAGAEPLSVAGWQRVRGAKTASWELQGPGVLWIEARSVGGGVEGSITVSAAGRRLGRAALLRPATETGAADSEPGSGDVLLAVPTADGPEAAGEGKLSEGTGDGELSEGTGKMSAGTDKDKLSEGTGRGPGPVARSGGTSAEDLDLGAAAADGGGPDERIGPRLAAAVGAPVGPRAALRVALAPGRHRYTVTFAGQDAVLLARVGRRNQRLASALRGDDVASLLRRGRRALADSESPRVDLVAALLASQAGEPIAAPGGAEQSPTLALTRTLLAAEAADLDAPARLDLARTLAKRVHRLESEALVWRARRVALDLLEGTGDPLLARELAGKRAAEAPVEVLERLARQIGGPPLAVRSPAVALLELARRQSPQDPELRAVYRDQWRAGTRWAALRADESAGQAWTWIEPWATSDDHATGTRALWRLRSGASETLRARVSAATPGRAALLRVYAQLAPGAGAEPLTDAALALAVDGRRWHSLALGPIETWRVAVPAGDHEVEASAPPGATLWSSLPPATARAPDGHILRMWPAAGGAQMRFLLPAGAEPGFVRVELRALAEPGVVGPRRARVWIARDDGPERPVDLWLPEQDPKIVAVEAQAGVGPRAAVVLAIGPKTRAVWVRVAEGAPRLAVAASIRATRGPEVGDLMPTPPPSDASAAYDEPALDRLARLSREIQHKPDDRALRLARAELLLDLDQPGYAFVDWREVTAGGLPPRLVGRATALAERLDALDAPATMDLGADVPVVIAPALAAAVGDDKARLAAVASAVAAARAGGPGAGLRALDRLGLDDASRWRAIGGPTIAQRPRTRPSKPPRPVKPRASDEDAPGADLVDEAPPEPAPGDRSQGTAGAGPGDRSQGTGTAGPGDMSQESDAAGPGDMAGGTGDAGTMAPDAAAAVGPAVGPLVTAATLRATWLDAQGRPDAAARVWARLEARAGLWQAGLMGVRSFLNVLDAEGPAGTKPPPPQAEGAGLAYGLAMSLRRTVRTPAVQRLATVAATRSKWSRIEGSERDGGTEALKVPRVPTLPSPNAAVRQALVVAPWDHGEATLLRPGYATVLDQKRATEGLLAVDLWCQTVRPDLGDGQAPRVRVTIDGVVLLDGPVPADRVDGTAIDAVPEGRHRVEVALDRASRGQICSVRLRDQEGPLGSVRPTRWRVAKPKLPVEVVVLGPTSLAIEARAVMGRGGAATRVAVAVAQGEGPFSPQATVTLSPEADPRATPESSRTIAPGVARTEVLALPEVGPQRVLLRPEGGTVLLRLQQRLDGEPTPVPRPPARALDLGTLVDSVAPIELPRMQVSAIAGVPAPQRFGTLFSELRGGVDDLEDSDDLRPRAALQLRLGWTRELLARRVWLQAAPELRARESTAPAGGGQVAVQAVFPRAGLRTRLAAGALTQQYAGGQGWSADASLHVDRLTWVAPRWQIVPAIDLRYRHQSLAPADVAAAARPVHPRIYTDYAAAHPFALRPSFEVRFQPLQDVRLFAAADVVPNSDFRGLDQVNLRGGLLGVVALLRRVVPEFALAYEGSVRLADADRAETYLQSRVTGGLGLGVWAGQAARVVFGVGDTLYASGPFPLRNVFELWLRVDLVLGRGLRDYGPLDMAFKPVREHRLWVDREGAP